MKTEKIPFNDENRAELIAKWTALGYRLAEEQRHLDGNWLIFTNEPEPRDLTAEVDEIKAKIADYDELKAKVEALEKK